ncbi:MAG TPA: SPOR domain-containing protein [Casimicrobium sp.]|jgi:DedD protein|nr:SPOR domain-containing protein [Casimicrobium sp.]
MASTAPDNAEQLRRRANRRLLGASILLLIAIIAVPMFLEREPPPLPDNVDVRIPPVEGTKFDPKFPPAADAKKAAAEKPAEIAAITEPTGAQATVGAIAPTPAPAAPKPAAPVVDAKPAAVAPVAPPKAAEKAPAKPAESAAPKDSTPADRKPGQLVVQVIAVRDAAVAKQTYDKAKSLKFPVYTEKIDVANGIVIRVRVGPFNTKQQAESARAKLAQAGLEAKVLTLQ